MMNRLLQHQDYAGDICSLSHKISDTEDMIYFLKKEAASAGLKLNCDKTKMLSLTGGSNTTIEVSGDQIEAVDRFTYLGSVVAAVGGMSMSFHEYGGTTI